MTRAENATRIVAAIGLLVGFAFAVPPASATEEATTDTTDLQTTTTIPPCATTPEPSAGPATVGLDDFCNPWVELETDAADCRAETDRPDANVDCETAQPTSSSSAAPAPDVCIPFTHEGETGPVSYAFTGCDVEVSVQTDLNPGEEDPTERCSVTADEDPEPVLIECRLSTATDGQNCIQIYWKYEIGPVVWERSGCDGDLYVKDDWQP